MAAFGILFLICMVVEMVVEHPYITFFGFCALVGLSLLGGNTSVTCSSVDCGNTTTGYLEKRYYSDGTYSVGNLSGTGRAYSDGTLDGTSDDSWIDSLGNEHRQLNGRNEVVSQCWYNPSIREIFDEDTGEKIGYEEEVLGVTHRRNI